MFLKAISNINGSICVGFAIRECSYKPSFYKVLFKCCIYHGKIICRFHRFVLVLSIQLFIAVEMMIYILISALPIGLLLSCAYVLMSR